MTYVSQGDFLRVVAYGVLLTGLWRAIRAAEFGRAVAEERARVAREIHDGLQQYLFSIATHVSMLRPDTVTEKTIDQLKKAATAAQQEARFAVLALSSASGKAPFDAALRRYVDVLTSDGALAVDLEIDTDVSLAPDEQIEVFRIVQEGLANVRNHAGARHADVLITRRSGRRVLVVVDDGTGFESEAAEENARAGQGPSEHPPPRHLHRRGVRPPLEPGPGHSARSRAAQLARWARGAAVHLGGGAMEAVRLARGGEGLGDLVHLADPAPALLLR